ncbi:MAG: Uma2 family endonuclease [Gemmataceae bacterium]|nr:Uma2 family endonuclease [Gemmataceae bacterium]
MSANSVHRATLADLAKAPGKAELIGGKLVPFKANGFRPGRIVGRIIRSLDNFAEVTRSGVAFTGTIAYAVPELSSGRESFSPDASFFTGPTPENEMAFPAGAPIFAIEVRSDGDYGPAAEREMATKWADYFEAGTEIVWDVDPIAETIRSYSRSAPETPTTFEAGMLADAGSALPGWSMDVTTLFRP